MWVIRGMLLGLAIFIGGGIASILVAWGIAIYKLYRVVRDAKAGIVPPPGGSTWDIPSIIMHPPLVLWLTLLMEEPTHIVSP
jgi:hypothetical protein